MTIQNDIIDINTNCISVSGKINTNTYSEFQTFVENSIATYEKTNLDFKDLIYISSAGLRALLIGEKKLSP